jgi:hypothetical protein
MPSASQPHRKATCICGEPIGKYRSGVPGEHRLGALLCEKCRNSDGVSAAQQRYIDQFMAILRSTPQGIDLALAIATDVGITSKRILADRADHQP